MSRKYPTWIKQQIEKIATHLITKSNVTDDVIPVIKQAFEDLDYGRFDPKDMQFTEQLDKNPDQYPNDRNVKVKVLGLELGASKFTGMSLWQTSEVIQPRLRILASRNTSRYFGIK